MERESESDESRSATAILALRDTDLRPVEIYVSAAMTPRLFKS